MVSEINQVGVQALAGRAFPPGRRQAPGQRPANPSVRSRLAREVALAIVGCDGAKVAVADRRQGGRGRPAELCFSVSMGAHAGANVCPQRGDAVTIFTP